jgi:hypothetical protein
MTTDDTTRKAALELLVGGYATQAEVAELAGASRQLVRYWANTAGIDVPERRRERLLMAWDKAMRRARR